MLAIDLSNRTTLVTGGARGIGRACAEACARAGSAVAIVDLDAGLARATADEIAATYAVAASSAGCDVTDARAVARMVDEAAAALGGLDHVVNNAGIQHVAPIPQFAEDRYDRVRAVDLDSVFYVTKAAWPHLVRRGRGRIVNVASVHGLVASPFKIAYVGAKHGVVGMTKVSAIEGAPHGITANAICPGAVSTELVRNQAKDLQASYGGGISEEEALSRAFLEAMPTKRFIETDEVGALCAFLCSDYAMSITGAAIAIDGGWSAK